VAFAQGGPANAVTIFVKLPAEGGPTVAEVDKALTVIPNVAIRVGSVTAGGEAFPIRLALTPTTWDEREETLHETANRVVGALSKEPGVAGAVAFPGPFVPHLSVDVNRDKCAMLGIELDTVLTTLQSSLGGLHATNFSVYGRMVRVRVQTEPRFARNPEDLGMMFVRSTAGEMVLIEKLVKIQKTRSPAAVVRVNGLPAALITAAPAAGQTLAEATARCTKLAQELLPRGYRVKDIADLSR
jgi:multidrug efflux pump subunit AcrB